jgi:predicted 3-demethylubiquinone-9 3-methyltransferase (glyoxalase superfamily)
MVLGRLIRVRKKRNDKEAAIYVVAEAETDEAVNVLQRALSRPRKEYEDLGHVNDTFVISLDLKPGQFKRI